MPPDWEDRGSKLAQANSLRDPISKKKKKQNNTKQGWQNGSNTCLRNTRP
jgi:hypothetical protein